MVVVVVAGSLGKMVCGGSSGSGSSSRFTRENGH